MDITHCRSLMGASLIIGRSDDRDKMVCLWKTCPFISTCGFLITAIAIPVIIEGDVHPYLEHQTHCIITTRSRAASN